MMEEKVVLFPETGPRKIKEHSAHLETDDSQQHAKDTVHVREESKFIGERSTSSAGFLQGGDTLGHIAIVDIDGIDL